MISGASEISEDLKKNSKDEILKIIQKCKKRQNEINKRLIKCLQNVILCQIHLVLNLEFVKFQLYLKAICWLDFIILPSDHEISQL